MMTPLLVAQRELRTLRADLLADPTLRPLKAAALANITLALTHLYLAELQLEGFPTPLTVLERLEKLGIEAKAARDAK